MAIQWTNEAKEALQRAPWVVRPIIRRRVETAARKEGLDAIDHTFLMQIKARHEGGADEDAKTASNGNGREKRIGEDVVFLAELMDQYCSEAHRDAERRVVGPAGVLTPYLDHEHSPTLCPDCKKLFLHTAAKRTACPHDPKPSCRHCKTPCQQPEYRKRMSDVMLWNKERPEPLSKD